MKSMGYFCLHRLWIGFLWLKYVAGFTRRHIRVATFLPPVAFQKNNSPRAVIGTKQHYPLSLSFLLATRGGDDGYNNGDENTLGSVIGQDSSTLQDITQNKDVEISPCCDLPESWSTIQNENKKKRGLILMDAFSLYHGFYLSKMARLAYGVAVVYVLSDYMTGYFVKQKKKQATMHPEEVERTNTELKMQLPSNMTKTTVEEWMAQLPVDEMVGMICESDSGLADSEHWSVRFNVTHHNGVNEARRDKYLMNDIVGSKGLDVVQQRLCRTQQEAIEFIKEKLTSKKETDDGEEGTQRIGLLGETASTQQQLQDPLCVVKPVRGVASDNVFLCRDLNEVEEAFDAIHGSTIFGSPQDHHDAVLVQEFASGTEYAIDTVSRDGHVKIAALWQYDKRPANGAPFVYHATELVDANTEIGRTIYNYISQALDGLGIRWGMTHSEVIVDKRGQPRLVEINCRQHNTDFTPLTMFCIGYNALDMVLSAYLDDGASEPPTLDQDGEPVIRLDWEKLPDLASPTAHGAIVHLVSHVEGTLQELNVEALQEIESMESVVAMEIYPHFTDIGNTIKPTVDIRTDAGWIHLVNDDAEAFQRDYERIVQLMPNLFHIAS